MSHININIWSLTAVKGLKPTLVPADAKTWNGTVPSHDSLEKNTQVFTKLLPKSGCRMITNACFRLHNNLWIDYAHQEGVIITVTVLDPWVHADLEQMAPNYASGWNSKYWQVYRVLSTALCGRCKGGMLIGSLHCEPGHWQLPDRLVSTFARLNFFHTPPPFLAPLNDGSSDKLASR